jgi:transglycosylase-like protein with SLT domain
MIDYAAAGRWASVVQALAIIESSENPDIGWGDSGLAFGLLQQHPAFFRHYYGRAHEFAPSHDDSWTTAQIKAAASFFELYEHMGLDLCIQAYNQGLDGVLNQGKRAPGYLEKFFHAFQSVRSAAKAKVA